MKSAFCKMAPKKGMELLLKMLVLVVATIVITTGSYEHIYGYTAYRGTVAVKSARARKTASSKGQFAFGVSNGETVTIIGEEKGDDGNTWYKIKVLNAVGYVRSDLIKKSNIEVKSESTPDVEKKDTQNTDQTTASTDSNSSSGNSSSTTSNSASAGGASVKGSNVIVRAAATRNSGVQTVLQNGYALTILATEKGKDDDKEWCQVSFKANDKEIKGYIRSDLVNKDGGATTGGDSSASSSETNTQTESSDNTSQTAEAGKPQVGKIKGTGVNIRKEPVDGQIVYKLTTGNPITVTNQVKSDKDGKIWYAISFVGNNKPQSGYVRSDLTEEIAPYENLLKAEEPKEEEKKEEENKEEENKEEEKKEEEKSEENKSDSSTRTESSASIKGIGVRVRDKAVNGDIVSQLDTGYPINVLEEVNADDGHTWYKISFSKNDKPREGYVRSDLVSIVNSSYSDTVSDEDFENQISEFPSAYKASLRALHEKYPSWEFKAVNTGLEWSDVVANESKVGKNLVAKTSIASWKSTAPQAYDWTSNTWYGFDGGSWAAASTELIQYYLDPRNFLDDSGIFQFETLEFQDYQNVDGVANTLSGTFMSGDYADTDGETRSYAQTFYDAGQACGVNPYHLASKAIQEQGVYGRSQSVAGNVGGLENLFNYFNIGAYAASGRSATINGLYYAAGSDETYLRPWNSRYRSIVGSAKYIADKYISLGQNTLYFQKFNVVNSTNGIYSHQYMSNVVAASYESARIRKAYSDLNTKLVFRIPIYNNMPEAKCMKPTSDSNPNTYLSKLWVEGYSFTTEYSPINSTYYLNVGADVESVNVCAEAVSGSSSVGGTGVYQLNQGENRIQVVCKSQSGATKGYAIVINKQ